MRSPSSRTTRALALVATAALVLGACSDDETDVATGSDVDGSTPEGSTPEGGGASGSLLVSGSSTVEPISVNVAEAYADINPDIEVDVTGPGTGDGFVQFCAGETDISDASRPIKDEEAAACADAGINYVELKVAFDGLAVLTSTANESVECLNYEDMYALMGPESAAVENWSDAQALAAELGSTTAFPDLPFTISAPGTESGTFDSYVELALEGIAEDRAQETPIRQFPGQSDDNLIIQGIQGADGSFGWVGYAFAANASDVKVLSVDGGDGCVAPSPETIADASYPLSRALYIYVNTDKAASDPALAEFVDFYVGDGLAGVSEVGYIDLPADQIEATRAAWAGR